MAILERNENRIIPYCNNCGAKSQELGSFSRVTRLENHLDNESISL